MNRWQLAIVIGQAVAAICLWGTLVGSMLPLVFRRLGIDPGYASSPFVATFVDVTGIVIYFSIAEFWLACDVVKTMRKITIIGSMGPSFRSILANSPVYLAAPAAELNP